MRSATTTYGDVSWERLRHLYKYHHRHTIRTLAIARLGSFDASPASQDAALVRCEGQGGQRSRGSAAPKRKGVSSPRGARSRRAPPCARRTFPHRRMNSSGDGSGMPDRTTLSGFAATFESWAHEMQFSETDSAAAGGFKCARG